MIREAPAYSSIQTRLALDGMLARGGFHVVAGDETVPPLADGSRPAAVVMVGNAGSDMWRAFARSQENTERQPHAMDRWTKRVLGRAARDLGAEVRFPFEGPPYLPFLDWAKRAEAVFSSPLGMLIHPRYGLWHAYRGALFFTQCPPDLPALARQAHPCESCGGKPCLTACPVDAFSLSGDGRTGAASYDVAACKSHISVPAGRACLTHGCAARRACPVGRKWTYRLPQAEFHMRAFVGAVAKELGRWRR